MSKFTVIAGLVLLVAIVQSLPGTSDQNAGQKSSNLRVKRGKFNIGQLSMECCESFYDPLKTYCGACKDDYIKMKKCCSDNAACQTAKKNCTDENAKLTQTITDLQFYISELKFQLEEFKAKFNCCESERITIIENLTICTEKSQGCQKDYENCTIVLTDCYYQWGLCDTNWKDCKNKYGNCQKERDDCNINFYGCQGECDNYKAKLQNCQQNLTDFCSVVNPTCDDYFTYYPYSE